jgi:hypothetical protein
MANRKKLRKAVLIGNFQSRAKGGKSKAVNNLLKPGNIRLEDDGIIATTHSHNFFSPGFPRSFDFR